MQKQQMVMTIAWKAARHGAKTFGGRVTEYLSESMKIAWTAVKGGYIKMAEEVKKAVLETRTGSRNHKSWVARLTGTHSTYKFDREFINDFEEDGLGRTYQLTDGVYDVCDGGDRKYIKVANGEISPINQSDVAAAL